MEDTGWRRNKYGGLFNINDIMNNAIRGIKDYNEDEQLFEQENSNVLYEKQALNDSQKQAIREYTSETGYGSNEMMNKFLNGEKQLSDDAASIVNQKADILESAITQPLNNDLYVYRGIKIRPKDLKVGQEISNKGFTSTSLDQYDAGNFGIGTGSIIKLKVKKGTKALYIGKNTSFHRNEKELLFGRNHSIKITKIRRLVDEDGDFMNYEIQGELI